MEAIINRTVYANKIVRLKDGKDEIWNKKEKGIKLLANILTVFLNIYIDV